VEEETYTVQEAARILRTTERTVRRHLERIPPQIEAPQETSESAETVDEQQGRGHSPTPMLQARQMPYRGPGGAGCSGEGDFGEHPFYEIR
jgi:hypothetical protein